MSPTEFKSSIRLHQQCVQSVAFILKNMLPLINFKTTQRTFQPLIFSMMFAMTKQPNRPRLGQIHFVVFNSAGFSFSKKIEHLLLFTC